MRRDPASGHRDQSGRAHQRRNTPQEWGRKPFRGERQQSTINDLLEENKKLEARAKASEKVGITK